jgi:hypothetical protein
MEGKRKFVLCGVTIVIACALCAVGKLDGEQCTTVLTVMGMVFGGGNVAEHVSKAWRQRA